MAETRDNEHCMLCGKELPKLSEQRRFPEACYDCVWSSESIKVPSSSAWSGKVVDVVDFKVELELLKLRVSVLEDCVGISIKEVQDAGSGSTG